MDADPRAPKAPALIRGCSILWLRLCRPVTFMSPSPGVLFTETASWADRGPGFACPIAMRGLLFMLVVVTAFPGCGFIRARDFCVCSGPMNEPYAGLLVDVALGFPYVPFD